MELRYEQTASALPLHLLNGKVNFQHLDDFSNPGNGNEKRNRKNLKLHLDVSNFFKNFYLNASATTNEMNFFYFDFFKKYCIQKINSCPRFGSIKYETNFRWLSKKMILGRPVKD